MKRIAAILVLGVFSFLLIAPLAIATDPEAQLPACCRAHGKHHCMMPVGSPSGAPMFRPQNSVCPLFPSAGALGASDSTVTLAASQHFFAGIVSHPAAHAQTEALYRISYSRTGQKRGPPVVLS
ncbi:MAG: hypothetical protein ABI833_15860 [Acidobacteriota bacterium]